MATTSRGQNNEQATGAATGDNKLSRTELNVIQTMVAVIVCFVICFSVFSIANFLQLFGVSSRKVMIFTARRYASALYAVYVALPVSIVWNNLK